MKQEIKHKLSGKVIFTAEIECEKNASVNIRLGLAVKVAIKNSANLRGANLRGANLRDADLRFGKVSKGPLEISGSAYYVTLWEGALQIGCEFHLTKEWNKYTDKEIIKMDGKDALKWWKVWKPILMNIAKENGMYSINKELNN